MKSWLKGGLWGLGICFLLLIFLNILGYLSEITNGNVSLSAFFAITFLIFYVLVFFPVLLFEIMISIFFGVGFFTNMAGDPNIFGYILLIIIYSSLGALIGGRVVKTNRSKNKK